KTIACARFIYKYSSTSKPCQGSVPQPSPDYLCFRTPHRQALSIDLARRLHPTAPCRRLGKSIITTCGKIFSQPWKSLYCSDAPSQRRMICTRSEEHTSELQSQS